MADLHDRAVAKEAALQGVVDTIRDAMTDAQDSLTLRHPDPATVDRAQWAASFGANQHIDVAATALNELVKAEQVLRIGVSRGGTPADAGALGPDLQANLIDQAALRVELRRAQERRARGLALVDEINQLLQRAMQMLAEAEQRTLQAAADDKAVEDLVTAVTTAPLDTLEQAATDALAGAPFTEADNRLDTLLPAELRTRASERFEEAVVVVADAEDHLAVGEEKYHQVDRLARPFEAPIERTLAGYLAARNALAAYVASAADRVDGSTALFEAVAAHPDLTDAQQAAVHDEVGQESKDSIAAEGELAGALVEARALGRVVDDAILEALIADPDADPEDDDAVSDARAALADSDIQDPIDDAIGDYDGVEASKWELDIPDSLWSALAEFVRIRADLTALSTIVPATNLVQPVEAAEALLVEALDNRDDHIRTELTAGLHLARRRADLRAAARTQTDRSVHYLRGDGSSGRTPDELASPTV